MDMILLRVALIIYIMFVFFALMSISFEIQPLKASGSIVAPILAGIVGAIVAGLFQYIISLKSHKIAQLKMQIDLANYYHEIHAKISRNIIDVDNILMKLACVTGGDFVGIEKARKNLEEYIERDWDEDGDFSMSVLDSRISFNIEEVAGIYINDLSKSATFRQIFKDLYNSCVALSA